MSNTPRQSAQRRVRAGASAVSPFRQFLFGKPIKTEHKEHALLAKVLALPVFASDAISSCVYASQEILLVLGAAGLWTLAHREVYTRLTMTLTVAIVALLAIVVTSYWQTVFAYPSGGGSYIVSRANLGVGAGLVAGAALLVDYVLTVAVSISSGIQNVAATPIAHRLGLSEHAVAMCVACIALLAFANLRGLRESGRFFAIPTYTFVVTCIVMLALGLVGPALLGWHLHTDGVGAEYARAAAESTARNVRAATTLTGLALLGVLLRAFASGCAALTGTEAVSNGIPAFREPRSRNAALTLVAMAVILAGLFTGISALATRLHIVYMQYPGHQFSPAVIDQLSSAVFGKGSPPYYLMQVATMLILVLAANTSFADFPRLAAILARDRYLPRQLTNQGDKLAYSNGILMLAVFAAALVAAFGGSVDRLIPLYAVGVFTAFTLSQTGMVRHWLKERGPRWRLKASLNGIGGLSTFFVLLVIAYEKFHEGAWMVIVIASCLVAVFSGISRHYERLRRDLSVSGMGPALQTTSNTVIVLLPSLHRGVILALSYAHGLSPDCRAVHVEVDPEGTPRLMREWERHVGEEIPLVILPSPYRSLVRPLMAYLEEVQKERGDHMVTVVLPEFVPGRWWQGLLHNANGILLKYYLAQRPGVTVANVRYHLAQPNGGGEGGAGVGGPPRVCGRHPAQR